MPGGAWIASMHDALSSFSFGVCEDIDSDNEAKIVT